MLNTNCPICRSAYLEERNGLDKVQSSYQIPEAPKFMNIPPTDSNLQRYNHTHGPRSSEYVTNLHTGQFQIAGSSHRPEMSSKSKNLSLAESNCLKPLKNPLGTGPNNPTHLHAGYSQLEQTLSTLFTSYNNVVLEMPIPHASSYSTMVPGSVILGK